MGKSLLVFTQKCMSLMYEVASVLKRGWMNGDDCTQILAPHPNLGTKPKFDHCLHNSGLVFCFGPERPVLLRYAQVWVALCLAPISALHPETGQLRAKSCRAGEAGGLLCGHLKHRASLSLKGKRQWHGKGLRSWAELKAEFCNSGGRQESPQGEGGISSRFLHLGLSVRHAPVWVFWRALTHPLKASSPAHTICQEPASC